MNAVLGMEKWARLAPDRRAVVVSNRQGYRDVVYSDLYKRTGLLAYGFSQLFTPGDRVVMMVPPGRGMFEVGYALMRAGIVPVLIDTGMPGPSLRQCLSEAAASGFIGVPEAVAAGRVLGWTKNIPTVVSTRSIPGAIGLSDMVHGVLEPFACGDDALAAIVFTSGSTGVPKGVEYTHGMFAAQALMITDMFEIRPGEVNVSTFAPFALLGPILGMTTVMPHMNFSKPGSVNPERVISAIHDSQATMMFGSPALLDVLGRHGVTAGVELPTLRAVLSAGAPVRADIQERMLALLSGQAEIHTPYGATEALPVATIGSNELRKLTQRGICVGRPVPGVRVDIIQISDDPIADIALVEPGEVGEIVVAGPNVSQSYFGRDAANELAKVGDAHRMGDLGAFDEEGRLWFYGRKSHRVRTELGDLYSVEVEAEINQHPAVVRSALVGVPLSDGTARPVICLELESGEPRSVISDILSSSSFPLGFGLVHKGFPTDVRHNSKIDRPRLAKWAERQLRKQRR